MRCVFMGLRCLFVGGVVSSSFEYARCGVVLVVCVRCGVVLVVCARCGGKTSALVV